MIAIVLPSLAGGGAERAMVRLARGLAADGLAVDLVIGRAEGPLSSGGDSKVTLINLESERMRRAVPQLVRYLRNRRPTAVLSVMTHTNIVTLIAAKLARIPTRVVVSERNTLSASSAGSERMTDRILARLVPRFYSRAAAVVAVSEGVAEDLVETFGLPRKLVTVAPNPTIDPSLHREAQREVGDPWMSSSTKPLVVAAGRLVPQKGFDVLLDAFAVVVQRDRAARLMILGDGPLRPTLEQQAQRLGLTEDDFAMPGFRPNPYPYFRQASVFVLSSRYEGMPNVLIEAAALGTPVVATDCPSGPREILHGGAYGPLVDIDDVPSLARAIITQIEQRRVVPRESLRRFEHSVAVSRYRRILLGPESAGSA